MFRSPHAYAAGNPDGDVTVVEFFDYNCGFCKRALPELVKLIGNDAKVRVVLKELPIFGEEFGSRRQGRARRREAGQIFRDAPEAVRGARQGGQGQGAKVAGELGLDVEKLEKDMEDASVKQGLDEAKELAQKLGLQGTPLFLVGDKVIPGAPDDLHDQLVKDVAEIREKGCRPPAKGLWVANTGLGAWPHFAERRKS